MIKINIISDSAYFPKGHGVHTAFINHVNMLKKLKMEVEINSLSKSDIVHIHTLGPFGLYHLMTNKHPKVISAHVIPSSFVGSLIGDQYIAHISKPVLKFYYNLADLIIAVAPHVKKELEDIGVTSPISILANPVDKKIFKKDASNRAEYREKYNLNPDDIVILGAGQLQTRKGIEDFFKIARSLPQYKFIWIGSLPFKQLTHQNAILKNFLDNDYPNILILKSIEYEEMSALYNMSDIFFFPSHQENASMVIIEAAACGLPLILRDLPEYKSLYTNGYLSGKNIRDFKRLIQKLAIDKKLYKQMTLESKRLADKFSFQNQKQVLWKYYENLLNQIHRSQA